MRYLSALAALLLPTLIQAQSTTVRLIPLSPNHHTAVTGSLLPEPFSMRVVDIDTGAPVAGVEVWVFPNGYVCGFDGCTLPPSGMYGHFASPTGASTEDFIFTTDANGVAVTSRFRAGSVPGTYDVVARIYGSFQPPGIQVRADPWQAPADFRIRQLSSVPAAPPARARIAAVSGADQSAALQTLLAQRFVAKVVDEQRQVPLAGVQVDFFIDRPNCAPSGFSCTPAPAELHGAFEADSGDVFDGHLRLTSAADGTVTAPAFRTGTASGTYEVTARVFGVPSGNVVPAPGQDAARFLVRQTGEGAGVEPRAVPALSGAVLALLALVLFVAVERRLRLPTT